MIDLHTHSTFSDGSLTPRQLVAQAQECGICALALTDHDTMEGIPEFLAACRRTGSSGRAIDGIPGVELSVRSGRGGMHMLGYLVDDTHQGLREMLVRIRGGREERNRKILAKLNGLGIRITRQDVEAFSEGGVVGRPHFARALIQAGAASTVQQVFKQLLGHGCAAYCERYRPSAEDAIGVVRAAGGVAVLAHPVALRLTMTALRKLLVSLVDSGLQGIEVYHSEHTEKHERIFYDMVRDFRLVATGGSDFHGDLNPLIRLGKGFGRLRVPDGTVEALRRAAAAPTNGFSSR